HALWPGTGPVKITRQGEKFRIFAGAPGDAEIQAVDFSGCPQARLAVSVLPPLTLNCIFYYVRNYGDGTPRHPGYGTRPNPGDEIEFLKTVNEVWGSQANITLRGPARELTMNEDLGDAIDSTAKMAAVYKRNDPTAQYNVFFVREVENIPGPDYIAAST